MGMPMPSELPIKIVMASFTTREDPGRNAEEIEDPMPTIIQEMKKCFLRT
jgi:hypothetical protein